MVWIYTVCKGRVYPGSAGQGLSAGMDVPDRVPDMVHFTPKTDIFFSFLHKNMLWVLQ